MGALAQTEANYKIRFEPTAKLQTRCEVPFQITVMDGRQRPVQNAQVQFVFSEMPQGVTDKLKAWPVSPGVYVAKPVFPTAGEWEVEAIVSREGQISRRTIPFHVPQ